MIAPAIEQVFQTHIQPLKRDEQLQLIERISQSLRENEEAVIVVPATSEGANHPRRVFGAGKDMIRSIASDFDAPLDDFAEYM